MTGSASLLLECIPQRSLTNRPILSIPYAADVAESDAYVAFRLRGLEAPADFERKGVTDYSAEAFLRILAQFRSGENAACRVTQHFRRGKADGAYLRPNLAANSASEPGKSGTHLAARTSTAPKSGERPAGPRRTLLSPFVEWEVPASVIVYDVRGIGLDRWMRTGNRVMAWLRDAESEVALVWHGSLNRGGPPAETTFFEASADSTTAASAVQSTILRLRAPHGW